LSVGIENPSGSVGCVVVVVVVVAGATVVVGGTVDVVVGSVGIDFLSPESLAEEQATNEVPKRAMDKYKNTLVCFLGFMFLRCPVDTDVARK